MPAMSNLSSAVAAISSPALRGGSGGVTNQQSEFVQQMQSRIAPVTRGQAGMRSQPHPANSAYSRLHAGATYNPRHPLMPDHIAPSQMMQGPPNLPSVATSRNSTPDPLPRICSDLSPSTPKRTPRRSKRHSAGIKQQTHQSPQPPQFMVNGPGGPIYS